jgi:Domain of unknown function (DUF4198)
MRRLLPVVTAVIALLTVAVTASAHDLFLRLETYFVPPDTPVLIRVLNGTFAKSEGSVQRNRLRDITVAGAGTRRQLDTGAWTDTSKTISMLAIQTGPAGTYVVGASTKPRLIRLEAKDFNAYLEEDGISDVLATRRRTGELHIPARERYHKHVKALLQVGDARTDDYGITLGYPAELVPLSNPYSIRVGQLLAFRCLVDGSPAPRQQVIAGSESTTGKLAQHGYRADSTGVVRVPITRRGKWYVKFIRMVPVRDSVDYESKWATLTFEVR